MQKRYQIIIAVVVTALITSAAWHFIANWQTEQAEENTPSTQSVTNTSADPQRESEIARGLYKIDFGIICTKNGGEYAISYSNLKNNIMYCMGGAGFKTEKRMIDGTKRKMDEVRFVIQTAQTKEWCHENHPESVLIDIENRPIDQDGLSSQRCFVKK